MKSEDNSDMLHVSILLKVLKTEGEEEPKEGGRPLCGDTIPFCSVRDC